MIHIKRAIERVPGGMMLVPLLLGAAMRTAFPGLANNDVFKSSFTGGLLTGALALLGAFYICLGSTIRLPLRDPHCPQSALKRCDKTAAARASPGRKKANRS